MEKENGKLVVGMISGALMGTAIALLVAPKAGRETRKVIGSKAGRAAVSIRQRCARQRRADVVEHQPA